MIFQRETFPSIAGACSALEAWTAGRSDLGSMLALINYRDEESVHTTLASREHWRAICRDSRDLDLSVIAGALEIATPAHVLRVVMHDATHSGSMTLAELRERIDIIQQ